jgi:hypothetical protein
MRGRGNADAWIPDDDSHSRNTGELVYSFGFGDRSKAQGRNPTKDEADCDCVLHKVHRSIHEAQSQEQANLWNYSRRGKPAGQVGRVQDRQAGGPGQPRRQRARVAARPQSCRSARFSFTGSSGDWYHYIDYYFRADGTLAKIHAQLNTFASPDGGISVVRDKLYSSGGKLLHAATRYRDLQSQQPRERGEFMDQPIPVYKTVRDLPFLRLLRS